MVNPAYWQNKKVLVTGHTGFKGGWLCHWLLDLGAEVKGFSLPPEDHMSLFNALELDTRIDSTMGNINDPESLHRIITTFQPDIVFHLAAQSLVLTSYEDPLDTFNTNIIGTANLLEALRPTTHECDVIVVTSDKCYLNKDDHKAYRESDPLGGFDPYSASKAGAEIVTASYRTSFFSEKNSPVRVASARAGNVIGGGDWADNRLIPDVVRARMAGEPVKVRHPHSIRPWQHVLEPLSGYLLLAEKLRANRALAKAWNFGPAAQLTTTVVEVLESIRKLWPDLTLDIMDDAGPHEAAILMLDSNQSNRELGWKPHWNVERAVTETAHWYQAWQENKDMKLITSQQIKAFNKNHD